jgi:hypothetical protein
MDRAIDVIRMHGAQGWMPIGNDIVARRERMP